MNCKDTKRTVSTMGMIKLVFLDGKMTTDTKFLLGYKALANRLKYCELELAMTVDEFTTIFTNKYELLTTKEQFDNILEKMTYLDVDDESFVMYFEACFHFGLEYVGPVRLISDVCRKFDEYEITDRFVASIEFTKRELCIMQIISEQRTIGLVDFMIIANHDKLRHYLVDYFMQQ